MGRVEGGSLEEGCVDWLQAGPDDLVLLEGEQLELQGLQIVGETFHIVDPVYGREGHTHTYIHTHTYPYIHTFTYTHIHSNTHVYSQIHIHTFTYTHIHSNTHIYTNTHTHI